MADVQMADGIVVKAVAVTVVVAAMAAGVQPVFSAVVRAARDYIPVTHLPVIQVVSPRSIFR